LIPIVAMLLPIAGSRLVIPADPFSRLAARPTPCRIVERSAIGSLPPTAAPPPSVSVFALRASTFPGWRFCGLGRPTTVFDDLPCSGSGPRHRSGSGQRTETTSQRSKLGCSIYAMGPISPVSAGPRPCPQFLGTDIGRVIRSSRRRAPGTIQGSSARAPWRS
jgi:hypothetical protein